MAPQRVGQAGLAFGHRIGLRGFGDGKTAASARPCRPSRTCTSHRRCGRRCGPLSHHSGNSSLMAFSPVLPQFCQLVHSRVHAQFCGTVRSQTGSWKGTFPRTALLRAVAVDDVGNLKAAGYGPVPCDVLPGQTSRDGEDHGAAVAGIITMDRLTLHIDCADTIATVNGPRCKALGAGASEHTSGAGFWFPTKRSGLSRSRATPPCATWRRSALPT